ncbi:MAG: hypothetical protein LUD15_04375 [Bacteroides sp.]|nr:hypothetical protein [Bacteroides sp.]
MKNFAGIRQSFYLFRENQVLSVISILGTALAISMIMVIIILFRARLVDNGVEINRSRTLYFTQVRAENKEKIM